MFFVNVQRWTWGKTAIHSYIQVCHVHVRLGSPILGTRTCHAERWPSKTSVLAKRCHYWESSTTWTATRTVTALSTWNRCSRHHLLGLTHHVKINKFIWPKTSGKVLITWKDLSELELLEKADQVTSSNKKGIFNAFFFELFSNLKKWKSLFQPKFPTFSLLFVLSWNYKT